MDTEKFWSMIEAARQGSEGNAEAFQEILTANVDSLSTEEILEFDQIMQLMLDRIYRADVWEAVWFIACGCGDDDFADFRNWLIAQGQNIYEMVLEDPENLADIVDKKDRFNFYFGFWVRDIAYEAYERKMKEPIPATQYGEGPSLGRKLLLEEDDMPKRFPRIAAKIGTCDEDELP